MVSIWWVMLAFLIGGLAGLLIFSLIGVAAKEDAKAAKAEKSAARKGQRPPELNEDWMARNRCRTNFG